MEKHEFFLKISDISLPRIINALITLIGSVLMMAAAYCQSQYVWSLGLLIFLSSGIYYGFTPFADEPKSIFISKIMARTAVIFMIASFIFLINSKI